MHAKCNIGKKKKPITPSIRVNWRKQLQRIVYFEFKSFSWWVKSRLSIHSLKYPIIRPQTWTPRWTDWWHSCGRLCSTSILYKNRWLLGEKIARIVDIMLLGFILPVIAHMQRWNGLRREIFNIWEILHQMHMYDFIAVTKKIETRESVNGLWPNLMAKNISHNRWTECRVKLKN